MGADISVNGRVCIVRGRDSLTGADVCAPDLRGGAALVLCALFANGRSKISKISHIDRGYEDFDENLRVLGAKIYREKS